jgi:hypothetical protein
MAAARLPARSEPVNNQPFLPAYCDGADVVFDGIIIDGQVPGFSIGD